VADAAAPVAAVTRMPARRRELLVTLKRLGRARAEHIAAQLDVTVSAVRQVLGALEAEGLVTHTEERLERGRPKHFFALTDAGDSLFPRRYGDLTNEVLGYISDRDPSLFADVFERRRRRRVENAKVRLAGGTFAERVAELAAILDEDGYLADFEALDDGTFRITEHNCAILDVARRYGHACATEISFLREAMPDAQIDRVLHIIEGAHACAYSVHRIGQ
jgi:DeoR family suf operon transcriptional repressor